MEAIVAEKECEMCGGDGLDECAYCGHEIDCEECGGAGVIKSDDDEENDD